MNEKKFKDFFISDTHFGHSNIIKHCERPFSSVEHMNESLIECWNKVVTNSDRVFVLGDFSFYKAERTNEILSKLKGQKFLVKGNHESAKTLKKTVGFAKVTDYEDLKFDLEGRQVRVVMSHFPFLSWHQMSRGAYHLHGHCHGTLKLPEGLKNARVFDVGVDNLAAVFGGYYPVTLETIVSHLDAC